LWQRRAGGIPEMIEDGVSGCLFDDAPQAIGFIRQFLDSPSDARRLVPAARIQAARQSWEQGHGILVEHYRARCAQQPIAGPRLHAAANADDPSPHSGPLDVVCNPQALPCLPG